MSSENGRNFFDLKVTKKGLEKAAINVGRVITATGVGLGMISCDAKSNQPFNPNQGPTPASSPAPESIGTQQSSQATIEAFQRSQTVVAQQKLTEVAGDGDGKKPVGAVLTAENLKNLGLSSVDLANGNAVLQGILTWGQEVCGQNGDKVDPNSATLISMTADNVTSRYSIVRVLNPDNTEKGWMVVGAEKQPKNGDYQKTVINKRATKYETYNADKTVAKTQIGWSNLDANGNPIDFRPMMTRNADGSVTMTDTDGNESVVSGMTQGQQQNQDQLNDFMNGMLDLSPGLTDVLVQVLDTNTPAAATLTETSLLPTLTSTPVPETLTPAPSKTATKLGPSPSATVKSPETKVPAATAIKTETKAPTVTAPTQNPDQLNTQTGNIDIADMIAKGEVKKMSDHVSILGNDAWINSAYYGILHWTVSGGNTDIYKSNYYPDNSNDTIVAIKFYLAKPLSASTSERIAMGADLANSVTLVSKSDTTQQWKSKSSDKDVYFATNSAGQVFRSSVLFTDTPKGKKDYYMVLKNGNSIVVIDLDKIQYATSG